MYTEHGCPLDQMMTAFVVDFFKTTSESFILNFHRRQPCKCLFAEAWCICVFLLSLLLLEYLCLFVFFIFPAHHLRMRMTKKWCNDIFFSLMAGITLLQSDLQIWRFPLSWSTSHILTNPSSWLSETSSISWCIVLPMSLPPPQNHRHEPCPFFFKP